MVRFLGRPSFTVFRSNFSIYRQCPSDIIKIEIKHIFKLKQRYRIFKVRTYKFLICELALVIQGL